MREGFVARRIEIHRDAVDTILEGLTRQVEALHEGPQPPGLHGFWFGAVIAPGKLGAPERRPPPGRSGSPRAARRRLLVHGIVDRTAKIPDGDDGAPLLGRQNEKRVVEAGLSAIDVRPSHLLDILDVSTLRRAARHTSSGASRCAERRSNLEQAVAPAIDTLQNAGAAEPGETQLADGAGPPRRRTRDVPARTSRASPGPRAPGRDSRRG